MSTTTARTSEDELTILARILGNEAGQLPPEQARYFLELGFSDRDKARMHDLAVRNNAAEDAAKGIRDPEKMRKACERMDRMREETYRKYGLLDVGVPAIRELRDAE